MHEFAVTKLLFNEVKLYAEAKNAERVTDVYLAVGDLRGMLNEWVIKYFAYARSQSSHSNNSRKRAMPELW